MTWATDDIRRLYREATARPTRAGDCPAPERLAALAARTSARPEREAVIDHVTRCSDCGEELRLLADLAPTLGGPPAMKAADAGRWGLGQSSRRFLAVAAAFLVAVGAGALWRGRSADAPFTGERGGSRTGSQVLPADGARLDRAPAILDWPDDPSGAGYRAVLYDFESTPLWEGTWSAQSRAELPEPLRLSLPRGRVYYWRVFVRQGVEVVATPIFRFEIAP